MDEFKIEIVSSSSSSSEILAKEETLPKQLQFVILNIFLSQKKNNVVIFDIEKIEKEHINKLNELKPLYNSFLVIPLHYIISYFSKSHDDRLKRGRKYIDEQESLVNSKRLGELMLKHVSEYYKSSDNTIELKDNMIILKFIK